MEDIESLQLYRKEAQQDEKISPRKRKRMKIRKVKADARKLEKGSSIRG